MRAVISAVVKTLVFTVVVPGTVAGYVPWRLRQTAAAVTGTEAWAAIAVIAIGIAIYLYTAFWSFAVIGGGTPAPLAPTKILELSSRAEQGICSLRRTADPLSPPALLTSLPLCYFD